MNIILNTAQQIRAYKMLKSIFESKTIEILVADLKAENNLTLDNLIDGIMIIDNCRLPEAKKKAEGILNLK